MRLIVGLGNPGAQYELTRHNVGFMLIDRLCDAHGIDCTSAGGSALSGQGVIRGVPVTVIKPQTFMNLSGEAVAAFTEALGLDAGSVLVAYDDIDLPLGRIRLRRSGGSGGHRGLESIALHLGGTSFERIRLGIGRPLEEGSSDALPAVTDHVLGPFAESETGLLDGMLDRGVAAIEAVLSMGIVFAMNNFNSSA